MTTKFILHGGFTPGKTDEDNDDFYAEILKDAPEEPEILIVPFAKEPGRIEASTQKVMEEFTANKWQKWIYFNVAREESFIEQLRLADIVYFQGGKTLKLLEALKKFPTLKEMLQGKIVAGESAGANVLTSAFYSPSAGSSFEGLAFLPIKLIPHYTQEYEGKLDNLKPDLETLLLRVYEHKVIEVDL
ncbi:Type 1 glutamine amidotransferase-like domain-containing protein [Candidatus Nomurabacteria bacterium]|nr:MAG: Type 1 glutamine amidotransferase-like domain-containing protein [Candidatus Nomurabacteria bacterium]